jgi:prolyl oligopeptidase
MERGDDRRPRTADDISVGPFAIMDGDTRYVGIDRGTGFYTNKRSILAADGRWVELAIPDTASFETIFDGQAIVSLVDPLGAFQPGSIVAFDISQMLAGQKPAPTLVMTPTRSQAVEEVSASNNILWIKALDDVSGKLFAYARQPDGKWAGRDVKLPANSTIHIVGTADKQDLAFATVEGMLQPTTLMSVGNGAVRTVQALPAEFDASQFTVDQRFATFEGRHARALFPGAQEGCVGADRCADPRLWRLP